MLKVGWGDVHPGNYLAKARQNNMAGQYKRGELFRRYHLENIDNNVNEESSDLSVWDEVEVVPLKTTKRKAFSAKNIGESKSATAILY